MAKRVQLVLNQNVSKLGRVGDVVEVAPGYARNYLLPQQIAVMATPGALKLAEKRREEERQRQLALKQEAETQKAAIDKVGKISIAKQAGEKDSIFGSVTSSDIADALKAAVGFEIDRRDITAPDVRKLGTYEAEIKLHPEVTATIEVEVVAE
jgi:large subunit ribosomal protein L9